MAGRQIKPLPSRERAGMRHDPVRGRDDVQEGGGEALRLHGDDDNATFAGARKVRDKEGIAHIPRRRFGEGSAVTRSEESRLGTEWHSRGRSWWSTQP